MVPELPGEIWAAIFKLLVFAPSQPALRLDEDEERIPKQIGYDEVKRELIFDKQSFRSYHSHLEFMCVNKWFNEIGKRIVYAENVFITCTFDIVDVWNSFLPECIPVIYADNTDEVNFPQRDLHIRMQYFNEEDPTRKQFPCRSIVVLGKDIDRLCHVMQTLYFQVDRSVETGETVDDRLEIIVHDIIILDEKMRPLKTDIGDHSSAKRKALSDVLRRLQGLRLPNYHLHINRTSLVRTNLINDHLNALNEDLSDDCLVTLSGDIIDDDLDALDRIKYPMQDFAIHAWNVYKCIIAQKRIADDFLKDGRQLAAQRSYLAMRHLAFKLLQTNKYGASMTNMRGDTELKILYQAHRAFLAAAITADRLKLKRIALGSAETWDLMMSPFACDGLVEVEALVDNAFALDRVLQNHPWLSYLNNVHRMLHTHAGDPEYSLNEVITDGTSMIQLPEGFRAMEKVRKWNESFEEYSAWRAKPYMQVLREIGCGEWRPRLIRAPDESEVATEMLKVFERMKDERERRMRSHQADTVTTAEGGDTSVDDDHGSSADVAPNDDAVVTDDGNDVNEASDLIDDAEAPADIEMNDAAEPGDDVRMYDALDPIDDFEIDDTKPPIEEFVDRHNPHIEFSDTGSRRIWRNHDPFNEWTEKFIKELEDIKSRKAEATGPDPEMDYDNLSIAG